MANETKMQAEATVDIFSKDGTANNQDQLYLLNHLEMVAKELKNTVVQTPTLEFAQTRAENFIGNKKTQGNHAALLAESPTRRSPETMKTHSEGLAAQELEKYLDLAVSGFMYKSQDDMRKALEVLIETVKERKLIINKKITPSANTDGPTEGRTTRLEGTPAGTDAVINTGAPQTGHNRLKLETKPTPITASYSNAAAFQDLLVLVGGEDEGHLFPGQEVKLGLGAGQGARLVILQDNNLAIVRADGSGVLLKPNGPESFDAGRGVHIKSTLIDDGTKVPMGVLTFGGRNGAKLLQNSRNDLLVYRHDGPGPEYMNWTNIVYKAEVIKSTEELNEMKGPVGRVEQNRFKPGAPGQDNTFNKIPQSNTTYKPLTTPQTVSQSQLATAGGNQKGIPGLGNTTNGLGVTPITQVINHVT